MKLRNTLSEYLCVCLFIRTFGGKMSATGQRPDVDYQQGHRPLFSPEIWVQRRIFRWTERPTDYVDLSPLSVIEVTNTLFILPCVIIAWCFSSERQV